MGLDTPCHGVSRSHTRSLKTLGEQGWGNLTATPPLPPPSSPVCRSDLPAPCTLVLGMEGGAVAYVAVVWTHSPGVYREQKSPVSGLALLHRDHEEANTCTD